MVVASSEERILFHVLKTDEVLPDLVLFFTYSLRICKYIPVVFSCSCSLQAHSSHCQIIFCMKRKKKSILQLAAKG